MLYVQMYKKKVHVPKNPHFFYKEDASPQVRYFQGLRQLNSTSGIVSFVNNLSLPIKFQLIVYEENSY